MEKLSAQDSYLVSVLIQEYGGANDVLQAVYEAFRPHGITLQEFQAAAAQLGAPSTEHLRYQRDLEKQITR